MRDIRSAQFTYRRLVTCLLVVAAALTCAREVVAKQAAASTAPAGLHDRDWKLHPAIVEMDAATDLYALGDAHGDYDTLVGLLSVGKLLSGVPATPDAANWGGGHAVLVCTGDFIDKYGQSIQVIALLRALQVSAEKAGGRVIVTLGNHEAEFLGAGGENRKGGGFDAELKAAGISPADVRAGRDSAGMGAWLRDLPAGAKVGDWFFCHAGNTGGKSLEALTAALEKEITEQGFSAPILSDPNSMLEARMHPRPWWDAGTDPGLKDLEHEKASKPADPAATAGVDAASAQRLEAIITPLGVRHLVFGHQPAKVTFADGAVREPGQMFTKFNGMVFMIDTGMSRGVDSGRGALLHISQGKKATAVYADGMSVVLWE